ncbi:MAG: cation:proton antiporter [Candidatus Marinimicrobia bacterium]|nr:cation:proton antiporter [Candidatus Neomarinimicrobiota bacterium]
MGNREIIEVEVLLLLGSIIVLGHILGKNMKYVKLPSIIGYMVFGVLLGPSLLNIVHDQLQLELGFITDIALSFVAFSIGLELKFSVLKSFGRGIVYIILLESFAALFAVTIGIYLLTRDLPLALLFGAIAPASAPAGTVAVILEYKARGPLTKALYTVVGFDDGLGIIIFGFAAAIAKNILIQETGALDNNILLTLWHPLKEITYSILFGGIIGLVFSFVIQKLKNVNEVLVMIVGFILIISGLCNIFHISIIFTNMVVGMMIVNTQRHSLVHKINEYLPLLMPILFILFFTLAGANLHLEALSSLGMIGVIYVIARTFGLISGSILGSILGKVEDNIRKYLGLGILSQAGVAIGLSLIVSKEFTGIGKIIDPATGMTNGDRIGSMVLTTVTVTCIFFELIGPILTKYALKKAGEIEE